MNLTHGALFNGIAGFPLAAAWAGIPTAWTVEIDEFCNQVSKKHFPDATQYTDIHHATNLPYVDIISGGFPCQPFSVAGKQLGNKDDRALWPEMLRIIREVKPAYVIGENVTGLINLALDDALSSLEAEGYTTETFVVPACGVGAPHRRDRLWIIAYDASRTNGAYNAGKNERQKSESGKSFGAVALGNSCCSRLQRFNRRRPRQKFKNGCFKLEERVTPNTNNQRCQSTDKPEGTRRACRLNTPGGITANTNQFSSHSAGYGAVNVSQQQTGTLFRIPDFRLTESPVCSANDGVPAGLVRNRSKQLKAYGNAIVPQVAYQIFKAIQQLNAA